MKVSSSRRKNETRRVKIALAILFIAILLVSAYCVTAYQNKLLPFQSDITQPKSNSGVNMEVPTDEQIKAGEDIKKSTIDNDNESSADFSVSFSSVNQTEDYMIFRVLISKVSDNGSCTLVLTKGDLSVTKTGDIQAGPSSSTCRGFDVPINELSSGDWRALLTVKINSSMVETSKLITVQ